MTHHAQSERPDPLTEDPPPLPSRPGAIELAAAILITSGIVGVLVAVSTAGSLPPGTEAFQALTVALDIGSIVVGVLVRFGRWWLLAVNYVAVLGFLDLVGAGTSSLSLILGLADIAVVVILFLHKAWFDALRERRAAQPLTPPTARPPTR